LTSPLEVDCPMCTPIHLCFPRAALFGLAMVLGGGLP
jgi:hypothetical protein